MPQRKRQIKPRLYRRGFIWRLRLKMENAYLKKLQALVRERIQQVNGKK